MREPKEPASEAKDPLEALNDVQAEESAEHPLLSAKEVADAKARARAKIEADAKKAAIKRIEEDETQRLRTEEGLVTGDSAKDEMVSLTLDLAEHSANIVINGRPYWHGHPYTVPRHVADSLREMQARGWRHQDEVDGKDLAQHYQRARATVVSAVRGVRNAPQPVAA